MRWPYEAAPEAGAERVVWRFLFLPVALRRKSRAAGQYIDAMQWRWMEWAPIVQRYYAKPFGLSTDLYRWRWFRWADD